ncbi:MARVEL domain-containing protein 3 isoform X2 [Syngnathus typhle]|uniref:MARVEL domain-containing protein 3 isoform X2 n=1 Tax=Syngnathus typhle TaxID=161592 RepID=UPI002A6A844C|nr:MARVEL domain-containing protein 3 isoform X2 [Syngnathus typhle]
MDPSCVFCRSPGHPPDHRITTAIRTAAQLTAMSVTDRVLSVMTPNAHTCAPGEMVTSGLSSMGGLGGISINSNFNLQGTELQKVRELDMHYSQMRAPGIYGGIAFSLTMGVLSLLFVVAGNKPPHRLSRKLLYGALAFQGVGAVAYVVAVALYLHFVIGVNATDVCVQRERLYARNGYTWMNCDVGGADAAVALFGLITAILYTAGTVLTFQTIRWVKSYLKEHKRRHAEPKQPRSNQQRTPLGAETTEV